VIGLAFSTRVKNFLKTGKINFYEQLKDLFLNKNGEEELLVEGLAQLSQEEKEQLLNQCWPLLSDKRRGIIVNSLYQANWQPLVTDFEELPEMEKIRRIELLAYISSSEVVSFLLEQMKNKREGIRLTACGALKKQNPQLVLEPVLQALTRPEEWLPSRIFEILLSLGPGLDRELLLMVEQADEKVQEVIVQILGEIGNGTCVPTLAKLLPGAGDILRLRIAEASEKLACKESWPLLVKLLEDGRWQTRMIAARTLGRLGVQQVFPVLEARENLESDPLVKECICEALEALEEGTLQTVSSWVREG